MQVQVKTANGITMVPIESKLLEERKVFIEGEINSSSAIEFSKQIMELVAIDNKLPIKVIINSPGGEVDSGLMMYDIIQTCETPIELYCMGRAYSMAAVLFSSGKCGRYMLEHSKVMLHEPLISQCQGGSASSVKSISDSLLQTREKLNKILAKHTGKTEEEIEESTKYDHYFLADEAIDFGLCDSVVGMTAIL